ncbi:MAG: PKD domain-containing protein, partial [Bacteroidota bacterium]
AAVSNITTSGTYSVTVTDGNGCQNTSAPTTITVNALPTATITPSGATTFCAGGSVNLTSSASNSYLWSNASTSAAVSNITTSGTYSVTVTDGNGCQNTSAPTIVTVNSLPIPVVNASGPLTFCAGNSVNLTASGGISYVWNNNSTNASITNITASGAYSVTVTNANNCSATSSAVTITVNPLPTVTITNPAAICSPGTVDLTAASITTGSTAGLNYSYWTSAAATQTLNTPFAIANAGAYYIRGTNTVTNCSVIQPVTVNINPQAVMQINTPAPVCSPQTVDLTAAAITNGSAAGLSFTYFTNAAATGTLSNPNTVNTSGIYYIKGTPASGCSAVVPVTVTINPLPTLVITNPAAVCSPQTINLTTPAITSGSSAGLSFAYFSNAALTTPVTNAQSVSGSGIFYIRATDATTGCASSGAVTVKVNAAPQGVLQTPATSIICENSSLTLNASGGNSYQWLLNQQPITGANLSTYNATVAGNYAVRFISAQNCAAVSSNTVQLELLNKPTVQFTLTNACAGVSTSFNNTSVTSASGGINWLWDFGDGSSSNQFAPTHIYNSAGTYAVQLTATSPVCTGFTETSLVTYQVQSALAAVRYKDVDVLKDVAVTITARAIGNRYLWQPAAGVNNITAASPSIRVNTTTEYTVAITNDINCTTTDTVLVKVIPGVDIYVPEGFTPNNDAQNDRLYPILVGMRQLNYFRVFNRWGHMIFSTKESSVQSGWNGLYLGVMQPMGTYTWIAEAVDLQGNLVRKTGTVLLLQ